MDYQAAIKMVEALPPTLTKYRNIGKIRALVKENLSAEIVQIDVLVKKLLVSKTDRKNLNMFFKKEQG